MPDGFHFHIVEKSNFNFASANERGAGGGESKHSRKMFRQNHTGCMRKELYMISIGSNMGTGSQNWAKMYTG